MVRMTTGIVAKRKSAEPITGSALSLLGSDEFWRKAEGSVYWFCVRFQYSNCRLDIRLA
jgi:hypothetical protein